MLLIFSIRNVFRKKSTSALATVGVGFGLLLVFVLGAFNAGIRTEFEENLNELVGQVLVQEKLQEGASSNLPTDIIDELEDTDKIGDEILRYNVETQAPNYFTIDYKGQMGSSEDDELVLVGLDPDLDEEWEGPTTNIIDGDNFDDDELEIILDSRLEDRAGFDVDIDDKITINLNLNGSNQVDLKIVGIYEQEDSGAPSFVPRDYYIYTSMETIWSLLARANETTNIYTAVYLLFDTDDVDETNTYAEIINENSDNDEYAPTYLAATSLAALAEDIQDSFQTLFLFTTVIGLITTIAGGMAIIVTQMMSVSSRKKEFAILKSTGWKNIHIFKNIIYESIILGLVGAAIGLGIGTFFILVLGSELSPFGGATPYLITWEGIIQVIGYGVGLGILGGLFPARKATKVRPVEVLKGG